MSRTARFDDRTMPWREILKWALAGTVLMVGIVLFDVHRYGGDNPVSLIQPGTKGPSVQIIREDFPSLQLPDGLGLDGQQFYAVARDPFHLKQVARQLDRPRYRLQRPLLPWLGWLLHPSGGGTGLVWALFLVGVAGLAVGGIATGVLSVLWRGPPWLAAVFPLLPGAYWSLRVTAADALSVALALAAVALAARSRLVAAMLVGVLAVLAKEPAILVLAGWALWRRTKRDALVAVVPLAVLVGWMGLLHVLLPGTEASTRDLAFPFAGLLGAFQKQWLHGHELVGMVSSVGALVLGALALARRRLSHPLGWALALHLAFFALMARNPIAMNFGGTRSNLALLILAIIALATPRPFVDEVKTASTAQTDERLAPDLTATV